MQYLDCFRVLTVVSSAAMNIGAHVSFSIMFPQGICPVVGLLGHIVILFLVFKGISMLFSIVAELVCIPTKSIKGFPFLHILSDGNSFCYFCYFSENLK